MAKMGEETAKESQKQCYEICQRSLQDYAVLIKFTNTLSEGSHDRLILRNIWSPLSSRDIKIRVWNGINMDESLLAVTCGQCEQLWVKLKDMLNNLLNQFDRRRTYATTWKRVNNGGIYKYKLFVSRIYAHCWRRPLLPFDSSSLEGNDLQISSVIYKNSTDDMAQKSSRSELPLCNTEYHWHVMNVERNLISSSENIKVKSSLKRKRGKAEKTITLEDLVPLLPGSLMDAAKSLKVSRSTLKRKCRQLGIPQWPSTKSNKRSRPMPSCKDVSEFALEPQIPHQRLISSGQVSDQDVGNIQKAYQSSLSEHQSLGFSPYKCWPQSESNSSYKRMRTSVQMRKDSLRNKMDAVAKEIPKFSHFCDSAPAQVEAAPSQFIQCLRGRKGMTTTVKATYKEDMIRFQFPLKSTVTGLKKEVERRLNLKAGTFKLKYWDDDDEWALLTCDSDWQDCVWVSRLSNKHVIRLLVQNL